jgi:hypothetical protein
LRCQWANARDRDQKRNQAPKGGLTSFHFLIHVADECFHSAIDVLNSRIGEIDVLKMHMQQETMMMGHPATKRLPHLLVRSLDAPIRKGGELHRIGLAGEESGDDRSAALADNVGDDRVQLYVGASSVFCSL